MEARLLAGRAHNEDAAVVSIPPGKALVQTTDVLAPIVNEAHAFGRIAAANALSDVYAMGGEPWCAMSLAFFPPELANCDSWVLTDILKGSLEAVLEAGAVLAGGHTVQDEELKYGLAVTGLIDPGHIARNDGLRPGQRLLLTKPLGVGILATGVKAHWDFSRESEQEIIHWCGMLNVGGCKVIQLLGLNAATDITGFGLGGHALEMAIASNVTVRLRLGTLPLMPHVLEYAANGLVPSGSRANRSHAETRTWIAPGANEDLISVVFDAQTSGGLLLAMAADQIDEAKSILSEYGNLAVEVGEVLPPRSDGKQLVLE